MYPYNCQKEERKKDRIWKKEATKNKSKTRAFASLYLSLEIKTCQSQLVLIDAPLLLRVPLWNPLNTLESISHQEATSLPTKGLGVWQTSFDMLLNCSSLYSLPSCPSNTSPLLDNKWDFSGQPTITYCSSLTFSGLECIHQKVLGDSSLSCLQRKDKFDEQK